MKDNCTNKKIRVIHLVGRLGSGGIESLLVSMHKNIRIEEIDSTFFLWSKDDATFYSENDLAKLGISVVYGNVNSCNKVQRFIQKMVSLYSFLKKEKEAFDIIHIHGSDSIMYLMAWVAKKAGIKNVVVHAHTSFSLKHKPVRFLSVIPLRTMTTKYIDYYIACSSIAGKYFFPKDAVNVEVIKNGIEADRFKFDSDKRNAIRENWNYKNSFVLGHIGRFSKEKNHSYALEVFKCILELMPNSKLVLVGEGPEEQKIRNKIDEMQLNEYVKILMPTRRIEDVVMGMDAMIFPSWYEGLPLVPIEAQACALPVYVSDTVTKEINISEYITYLGIKEKPCVWADTIIKEAPYRERKDMTYLIKDNGFDISCTAKKMVEIYKSVVASK